MKKIILGILLAIIFVGCGNKDSEIYTSYEYKQDLATRLYPDDGKVYNIPNYDEVNDEWGLLRSKLLTSKDPGARAEFEMWMKVLKKRKLDVERNLERIRKEEVRKMRIEVEDYKNNLKATPYPSINSGEKSINDEL